MVNFDDDFPMLLERETGMPDYVPAVAVAFGKYYERDDVKSAEAGHEVYRDVVFVKIAVPGDKSSLYFQPMQDSHKNRFPRAFAAFQEREKGSEGLLGLPIEQWAPISRSVAMTLKAAHIHTVEALAEVHDGHIDKIGVDGRGLRGKAQAFLAQARDSSAILKEAAEKKELQDQLSALQAQILALQQAQAQPNAGPAVADDGAAARRPRARA